MQYFLVVFGGPKGTKMGEYVPNLSAFEFGYNFERTNVSPRSLSRNNSEKDEKVLPVLQQFKGITEDLSLIQIPLL